MFIQPSLLPQIHIWYPDLIVADMAGHTFAHSSDEPPVRVFVVEHAPAYEGGLVRGGGAGFAASQHTD